MRLRKLVSVFIVAILTVGASCDRKDMAVAFRSESVDLGSVAANELIPVSFSLRNTGGNVVRIADLRASCACILNRSKLGDGVGPGQNSTVEFSLETGDIAVATSLDKHVLVRFDNGEEFVLNVRAIVRPDVEVQPGHISIVASSNAVSLRVRRRLLSIGEFRKLTFDASPEVGVRLICHDSDSMEMEVRPSMVARQLSSPSQVVLTYRRSETSEFRRIVIPVDVADSAVPLHIQPTAIQVCGPASKSQIRIISHVDNLHLCDLVMNGEPIHFVVEPISAREFIVSVELRSTVTGDGRPPKVVEREFIALAFDKDGARFMHLMPVYFLPDSNDKGFDW